MIRPAALIVATAMLAAGCVTTSEPPPSGPAPGGPAACDAAKAQFAVGRPYSEALAEQARAAAGAERVRKIEPGRAYTKEFIAARLNLEVSASDVVTTARCG